jgi:hypothetical protein
LLDVFPVAVEHGLIAVDIGAIDRKAGDDLPQRIRKSLLREVPRPAIALRNAVEPVAEHVQLARHRRIHNQVLAAINEFLEIHSLADELGINSIQDFRVLASHK